MAITKTKNRIPDDFEVMPYHKIRILKDSKIYTTHPSGERVAKRDYVVLTQTRSGPHTDEVTWVGSGKYLCWTKKENCEFYNGHK